jgi:hypothetical protein
MTPVPKPTRKCRQCNKILYPGSLHKYCDQTCRAKYLRNASKIVVLTLGGRHIKVGKEQAKTRAWKAFSRYIRQRDEAKGCVTCHKMYPWKELEAGHAIQGRGNSILFDEELVNGQCVRCNRFMGGMYPQYSLVMIKRHGVEWWEQKLILKTQPKTYSIQDYLDLEQKYLLKSNNK